MVNDGAGWITRTGSVVTLAIMGARWAEVVVSEFGCNIPSAEALTEAAVAGSFHSMKFGAHMSTSGGVWKALQRGRSIHCEVVQVFVKNNMQWFGKPFSPDDLAAFAKEQAANHLACVFGHAGYLINLGGPDSENRERSIKSLIQEIQLATELGLPFLVLHPGAHLGAGEPAGIKQIIRALDQVFAATKKSSVRIALENTAGQGTCLGYRIAHLAAVIDGVKNRPPGHLSGYCALPRRRLRHPNTQRLGCRDP